VAKLDEKWLQDLLEQILPQSWLEKTAREVGAVKRERKVKVSLLVWTMVLGFADATRARSIASLRMAYEKASGEMLAASSFYYRFTKELATLMAVCVQQALAQVAEPQTKLKGVLEGFVDLVITDSTVIRLNELLKQTFPGARVNHSPAALKLHVVISAFAHGARSIKITSGKTADGPVFKIGKWVAGRLLLFDLGYFCFQLFARIDDQGGFFVSRAKDGFNPVVMGENIAHGLRRLTWGAVRLQDILHRFKGQPIDLRVRLRFKRRVYRGVQSWDEKDFRLVGVFNPDTRRYHLYLTNIQPDTLTPEEVARAYSARWEIELLFKELKGAYHLEDLNTANEWAVRALILATLITGILARTLQGALLRALPGKARQIQRRRFANLFSSVASALLNFVASMYDGEPLPVGHIVRYLLHESRDPNLSRSYVLTGVAT